MIKQAQTIVTNQDLEEKNEREEETPAVTVGYPPNEYKPVPEEKLQEIGSAEAKKEQAQKGDLNTAKFDNLVKKNSNRTLLKIKTAKLFDFFPDEVVVETTKINVSLRDFFFMRRLHTISIEDISDVFVETTPFYATLKIVDKDFIENSVEIKFLKKPDAKKARRLIQGLVTAYKEGVDLTSLPDDGLLAKLEVLGSAGEIERVGK